MRAIIAVLVLVAAEFAAANDAPETIRVPKKVRGIPTASLPAACTNGTLVYDSTTKTTKECTSNAWTATVAPVATTATVANALKSATTDVNTSSAAAPSSGQVLTATSSTAATWQAVSGGGGGFTPLRGTSPLATYYSPGQPSTGTNVARGNLRAMFFTCPYTGTIDRLVLEPTGSVATSVGRVGIYSTASTGYPDALLVDSGEMNLATGGTAVTATVSLAVTAGTQYWIAYLGGVADANLRVNATGVPSSLLRSYPAVATAFADPVQGITVAQAYGALPNPFTAGATYLLVAANPNTIPVMGMRFQ